MVVIWLDEFLICLKLFLTHVSLTESGNRNFDKFPRKSKASYPDWGQQAFEDVRHRDCKNGASGRDDAIDEADVPLEVVAEDDKRRRVGQRRSTTEKDAVREA